MTPQEYCAARAAPEGSSIHYALRFHGAAQRRALNACFAFLAHLHADSRPLEDPTPTVRRLLWWQNELAVAHAGDSSHPVVVELVHQFQHTGALQEATRSAVAAMLRETGGWRPATMADWTQHCGELHGAMWRLGARVCDARQDDTGAEILISVASAIGQAGQLQSLVHRTRRGRCPIPDDILGRHGMDAAGTEFRPGDLDAAAAICECARYIRHSIETVAAPDSPAYQALPLFGRVLLRICLATVGRIERQPRRVHEGASGVTPLRKLWIAWRESLRVNPA